MAQQEAAEPGEDAYIDILLLKGGKQPVRLMEEVSRAQQFDQAVKAREAKVHIGKIRG